MSDAKTQDDDNQLHDALAAMTNDLLIVMVKRLGSPVTIPIAEIDGVKGLGLSMKIVGDDFEFDIIKDVSLPEAFVDIESSSMTKARYDGKTKSLHIVFKNGQQWRYHNFPTGVAYEFSSPTARALISAATFAASMTRASLPNHSTGNDDGGDFQIGGSRQPHTRAPQHLSCLPAEAYENQL